MELGNLNLKKIIGVTKEIAPNIIIDSQIRFGKPIIKGTRITVEEILGAVASGMDYQEIEKEYGIKKEDILGVIRYSASFLKGEHIKSLNMANI